MAVWVFFGFFLADLDFFGFFWLGLKSFRVFFCFFGFEFLLFFGVSDFLEVVSFFFKKFSSLSFFLFFFFG